MFESATTQKEWLTDVEYYLIDLQAELLKNPFNILPNNLKKIGDDINQALASLKEVNHE